MLLVKIFLTLLFKNFMVTKRKWKSELFQTFCQLLCFFVLYWLIKRLEKIGFRGRHFNDTHYEPADITFRSKFYLYWSPNNNSFTKALISDFKSSTIKKKYSSEIYGFSSEEDLIEFFKYNNSQESEEHVAIIFEDNKINSHTKNLNYRIRSTDLNGKLSLSSDYFEASTIYSYREHLAFILPIQMEIDKSFIRIMAKKLSSSGESIKDFGNRTKNGHVKKRDRREMRRFLSQPDPIVQIQEMPTPEHYKLDQLSLKIKTSSFPMLIIFVFGVSLLSETSKSSSEKFLGTHVLMKMNGVSNFMSMLSWVVSGVIFVFLTVALPMIIIFSWPGYADDELNYFHFGNSFIICLVFILFLAQFLIFGIHVSAYFTRAILATIGVTMVNYGSIFLSNWTFINKSWLPYLGIIFPNILLERAVDEILHYEISMIGVQWSNIFELAVSGYGFESTIGMTLLFFLIGTFFHFIMALYIYDINPGKFGTRKHPLYFIPVDLFKESNPAPTESIDTVAHPELFEIPNTQIYEPKVQIRNLKKTYYVGLFKPVKVHALKGISIDFNEGEIICLLGHNGAGKTTTMSILTGMLSPSEGVIFVDQKDIEKYGSEIRNDMGLCPQSNMVFPNLSIQEQLLFFGLLKGRKQISEVKTDIDELLQKLKLYEKRKSLPNKLSGGQQRRLCLGMAIVTDSNFLILDEPTSGLDPENRRVVWDILLKMKGSKTILISTHDMEEADILGDRIAILHGGELRSYGTPFFLKKILGEGNVEVAISVKHGTDKRRIFKEFGSTAKVINEDGDKIVLTVESNNELPDLLDKVENKKVALGITGMSVSLLTLEQVFLKVTQNKKREEDTGDNQSARPFEGAKRNSRGKIFNILYALICKKLTYTLKHLSVILGLLVLAFFYFREFQALLGSKNSWIKPKDILAIVPINLTLFNNPKTFYHSENSRLGEKYKIATQSYSGKAIETNLNVSDALLQYGSKYLAAYTQSVVAAVQFSSYVHKDSSRAINSADNNKTYYKIFYSKTMGYSIPISMNLMNNAILKNLTSNDYSIGISFQDMEYKKHEEQYFRYTSGMLVPGSIILTSIIMMMIVLFLIHPTREHYTGIKHLQKIAGASFFTYWGVMFVFDFIVFSLFLLFIMLGIIILDIKYYQIFGFKSHSDLTFTEEIRLMLILFGLLELSSLPFVYIFSFMNRAINSTVKAFLYFCVILIVTHLSLLLIFGLFKIQVYNKFGNTILKYRRSFFHLFIPISFMSGQTSYLSTLVRNSRCKFLPDEFYQSECPWIQTHLNESMQAIVDYCCYLECYDHLCEKKIPFLAETAPLLPFWQDGQENVAQEKFWETELELLFSIKWMVVDTIAYIIILFLLESQWITMVLIHVKNLRRDPSQLPQDKQVIHEKQAVAKKISDMNKKKLIMVSSHGASTTVRKSPSRHSRRTIFHSSSRASRREASHQKKLEKLGSHGPSTSTRKSPSRRTLFSSSSRASQHHSQPLADSAFLVFELKKRYGSMFAVQEVSFHLDHRECFGLLGVNGAGKTTTFRMMTGGEIPDKGMMYMGDRNFKRNRSYFFSRIGYCPQNDAIIESLNSYDHLRLFARIRGIPERKVNDEVDLWIQRLNLTASARQPSGTYSGGNKRRLNIAIALIGIPDIVFMDEPTTGVDPGARRSLWSVIQSCQATGQSVVLTSHSMEECEVLCNRLAIMVDGRFVCIGASQELKQRFGTDYNIQIKLNAEKARKQIASLKEEMAKSFDCEISDENLGYINYHVKPDNMSWRKMYDIMNRLKKSYSCIDDYTVSSSTLEQLFLLFAKSAKRRGDDT